MCWKSGYLPVAVVAVIVAVCAGALAADGAGLDPRGKLHIPIGIGNSLDTLKTFVEAEGCFSPGVGSYGVYFWLFDKKAGRLFAPTMGAVKCAHVQKGDILLYAALRPLGPAGFDVKELSICPEGDALLVDGHAAIVAAQRPSDSGVLATDTIGDYVLRGTAPGQKRAISPSGDCSGVLCFELMLLPGETRTLDFVCPVLPGRRAVGHRWDGVSEWAQFDLAELNPASGGSLQPDPGLEYYRGLNVSDLFVEAEDYWRQLTGKVKLGLPDKRWEDAFAAIIGHAAMEMNEGAPDVAVVNYNVFNRDGVYVANIFQKSGNFDLAAKAIDYFIEHPFNGRSYPEADNPGQILWAMAQQFKFTRDRAWAKRIYPAARKIGDMIKYYRTTDGPHWVMMDGLEFGENVPEDKHRELKPGRCDGHHPEYTQAFDIAGLFGASSLAVWAGKTWEAHMTSERAHRLLWDYDRSFGGNPRPPARFVLRLPASLNPQVTVAGRAVPALIPGEFILPARTLKAEVDFGR